MNIMLAEQVACHLFFGGNSVKIRFSEHLTGLISHKATSQVHPSSIGVKSNLFLARVSFKFPCLVKAVPNRAVLVGYTQSNISTPRQEQSKISIG